MSKIQIFLIFVYLISLITSIRLTEYVLSRKVNKFQIFIYWLFCLIPIINSLFSLFSIISYCSHNEQKIEKIIIKCDLCYKILNYFRHQPFNK